MAGWGCFPISEGLWEVVYPPKKIAGMDVYLVYAKGFRNMLPSPTKAPRTRKKFTECFPKTDRGTSPHQKKQIWVRKEFST